MGKEGIAALGISASIWAGMFFHATTEKWPLLTAVFAAMYLSWTVPLFMKCKCGGEEKKPDPNAPK